MGETEVWQGTLALMILITFESMGPLHRTCRRGAKAAANLSRFVSPREEAM